MTHCPRRKSAAQKPTAKIVQATLRKLADPQRAKSSAWFFKTGPGQSGEGDIFLGIRVPRTALRYAIEHLPPDHRKQVLAGKF